MFPTPSPSPFRHDLTLMAPGRSPGLDSNPIAILIVDDDAESRRRIREAIAASRLGNAVDELSNGEDALEWLHRRRTSIVAPWSGLILLDVDMPGMNGVETLRRLRGDPRSVDVPVVLMTDVFEAGPSPLSDFRCAGVCAVKPTRPDEFLRIVLHGTNFWLRADASARHA